MGFISLGSSNYHNVIHFLFTIRRLSLLSEICNNVQFLRQPVFEVLQIVKSAHRLKALNSVNTQHFLLFVKWMWSAKIKLKAVGGGGRGGRCSVFLTMRCFNDAMFSNS